VSQAESKLQQLTSQQQERRERVVHAAVKLAAAGGYDSVQMREVAETADVAIGTVYNYFASKDHLLAAALVSWNDRLRQSIESDPPDGATTVDRFEAVLERALGAMLAAPDVSKAMITAMMSASPEVARCKEQLDGSMGAILDAAFGDADAAEYRARVSRTVEHVWYSVLIGWVNDWIDDAAVERELTDAVRLIFG